MGLIPCTSSQSWAWFLSGNVRREGRKKAEKGGKKALSPSFASGIADMVCVEQREGHAG